MNRTAALLTLALVTTALARAQQPKSTGDLDTVLHQLDTASRTFKSAEANLRWDVYERVVQETTTQCGSIYFLRDAASIQMGALLAPSATDSCTTPTTTSTPDSRALAYKKGELQMFEPTANHLTILHAGSNQSQYESFLTLGFGGSGTDLAKAWNITDLGTEVLNDGATKVTTVKLNLVSKNPALLNTFTHILIWVDPTRGVSLKQQFFTPAGDYRTTWFDHIRYNQKVDTGTFAIKTNGKTQIDRR